MRSIIALIAGSVILIIFQNISVLIGAIFGFSVNAIILIAFPVTVLGAISAAFVISVIARKAGVFHGMVLYVFIVAYMIARQR